jgi:hypothetical protein
MKVYQEVENCLKTGKVCEKLLSTCKELEGVIESLKELSYEGVNIGCDADCECYEDCDGADSGCIESAFDRVYFDSHTAMDDCFKRLLRACDKCGGKNYLINKLIFEADAEFKRKALMKAERELAKAEFELVDKEMRMISNLD